MTITLHSRHELETMRIASDLVSIVQAGDILLLNGDLGAGKTVFVRGLAAGLGIDPRRVSSPTYVICHEYTQPDGISLLHLDAYRMSDSDELDTIGWEDRHQRPRTVSVIEWADRVGSALPQEDCFDVTLAHVGEAERTLTITLPRRVDDSSAAALEERWHESIASLQSRRQSPSESGITKCRTCGSQLPESGRHGPFCSDRCRLVDLGAWMRGDYVIGSEIDPFDLPDDDQ